MLDLIFQLQDVKFSYLAKYPALRGIDLNIYRGEKIAIIGPNGCGKSTLLHILDGLIFPDHGSISAFGRKLNQDVFQDEFFAKDFRRKVGLVFQNSDVQLFCPTVREDIVFGPLHLGILKDTIQRNTGQLTAIFNIAGILDKPPYQLSIGEKKKVALASTLAVDPDVLLLDEPTAGLDPATSQQIIDIITRTNTQGRTIVTATHDLHLIEEIADTVYLLSQEKRIVACGPAAEILGNTRLLEENNLIPRDSNRIFS